MLLHILDFSFSYGYNLSVTLVVVIFNDQIKLFRYTVDLKMIQKNIYYKLSWKMEQNNV